MNATPVRITARFPTVPARALESAPVSSKRAVATLVSDTDAVQPGTPVRVGLRLRMADGWHTYWKNPGDAGAAPTLDVTGAPAGPIAYRVDDASTLTSAEDGAFDVVVSQLAMMDVADHRALFIPR